MKIFWKLFYYIDNIRRKLFRLKSRKGSEVRLMFWRLNPHCFRCNKKTTFDLAAENDTTCILHSVEPGKPRLICCNLCAHRIAAIKNNSKQIASGTKIKYNQRYAFWKKDPKCHWCGIPTVMYPHLNGKTCHDDEATIDHLRSRLDPTRWDPQNGEKRRVLSCKKCNEKRAEEECAALSLDELHKRSGRGDSTPEFNNVSPEDRVFFDRNKDD